MPPLPCLVALRKESVDRNCDSDPVTDKAWAVALRKESVDRNKKMFDQIMQGDPSLSARRAWIEMVSKSALMVLRAVSLSARRAWIEILTFCSASFAVLSLSARRAWIEILQRQFAEILQVCPSLSARRAWIEISKCAL